jgi:NADH-quinone oxidoreductase subunit L
MITHAFFKALLFLGSGSVIHGMDDEQDMRKMGGLRKVMPITAATFIIGWLAIAGVPPFAGFWSKDEILLGAYDTQPVLWAIGLLTALLTAFYMSRQVFMVFFGDERWNTTPEEAVAEAEAEAGDEQPVPAGAAHATDAAEPGDAHSHGEVHPHESPWLMTLPLVVLSGAAILGGAVNLPLFGHDSTFLANWLEPIVEEGEHHVTVASGTKVALAAAAVAVGLIGIAYAAAVYLLGRVKAVEPKVLEHAWYYDEAVSKFVAGPGRAAFDGVAAFDRVVIDGAVNGVAGGVRGLGRVVRVAQSGFVRAYALGMTAGVVIVLGYFLSRLTF